MVIFLVIPMAVGVAMGRLLNASPISMLKTKTSVPCKLRTKSIENKLLGHKIRTIRSVALRLL